MMKVTFLGTGTSQGVPIIGCHCAVCQSKDPKDKRLRSSVFIEVNSVKIIIDTGPDFRQQLLREHIEDISAILYTHEHKDHVAGLDDVRPINFLQEKDMPIYAEPRVIEALEREFHYAFSETSYPGVPQLIVHPIGLKEFEIEGVTVTPIRAFHHQLPILGFRIGNFAYITDANRIEESELNKLAGLEVLVVNALRKESHISHFTLDEAVEIATQINPKQTYLTHISHMLGKHNEVNKGLPKNISLAFDQLQIHL